MVRIAEMYGKDDCRSSRSLVVLMVVCLWLASLTAQAADERPLYKHIPVDPKYQANLAGEGRRVLAGCITAIRKLSPESRLDAYIEEEDVKYIGTDEERVQMEKCMAEYGFPIVSMHRPGPSN